MTRCLAKGLVAAAVLAAAPVQAAPRFDPLFTDHAVLQRERPIQVSGEATPRERLTVSLAGTTRSARADANGRWMVALPAMKAGGPHRLEARGSSGGAASASDVMIGDVWLCSGQSNMEWAVRQSLNGDSEVQAAGDDKLRMLTVAQRASAAPQNDFAETPRWQAATPQSVADFSGACYFMARELRASEGVAIGAIDASWGGTRIFPWIDEVAARTVGGSAEADLLALSRTDPPAAASRFAESWGRWWRERTGDAQGQEPWRNSSRLKWQPFPQMGYWDEWENSDFGAFDGGVWARHRFTLGADEAAQPATLSLGVIDDLDQSWVNGVGVGSTYGWAAPRDYPLGRGILRPGENEIVVYVGDSWGPGGFQGPAERLKLTFGDGRVKPLATGWEYSIAPSTARDPPRAPWDSHAGVATLYNGMIAPLGPLSLKGVAWYQGESDVGIEGYDARLAALMTSWRRQFRDRRLPFLVVGLAGFGEPGSAPVDSGWAQLQDAQRRAAARDRHALLVPALDVGERHDIHPPNKQEVGRRLALAARSLAYGNSQARTAPLPVSARRAPEGLQVGFTGGLRTLSGARPLAFELCGDTQESCRYADARVSGNMAVLADDGRPATRVRYAWSDFAIVNLYSGDLPVPTFELPIG